MCDQPPGTWGHEIRAPALFQTVVAPHRSLPAVGFLVVMGALVGLSIAIGVGFMLVGAWPVIGFLGIDIILVYVVFRISYRSARQSEHLRLTAHGLEVVFLDGSGQARRTFIQPYWASVHLEPLAGGHKRLLIRSHGKTLEIGAFLGSEQKVALAESLSDAIRGVQNSSL